MSDRERALAEIPQDEAYAEYALEGSILASEEDEKNLMDYLLENVLDVLEGDVYEGMKQKASKWRRQREAVPEQESKSFPWENASNVAVPLAMMCTNGIASLVKSSLMERDPFWHVRSRGTLADDQSADALTQFLDAISDSPYHLDLKRQLGPMIYELVSIGTQFVEVPWVVDRWSFKKPSGEVVDKIRSSSPKIISIPIENFLMLPYFDDVQRAPWCGVLTYLTEHELLQRQRLGVYENVEALLAGGPDGITEERTEILERMGIAVGTKDKSNIYAVVQAYVFWDADGDGFPEDLKVTFHPETGTFLRVEFNTLGVRPIARLTYFDRPGELYGIGVGWIVERLQDEIDALHNMRIDGTMLSMLQMYVSSRGSNLAPEEEFRPLKHIQVDSAKEDFLPIKFPDIGPGTIQAEYVTKEYADRATGATDAMMGFESFAGSSRRTASGTMFLAQQNMRTLQPVIDSIEDSFGEVGRLVTFQLIRNKDFIMDQIQMIQPTLQPALEEVFMNIELEDIPAAFRFGIKTTDLEKTEDAKKQSKLTLMQLYAQYGQQIFQLLPTIYGQQAQVPPEIKQIATKFFVGATNMMDDIFTFFGEERSDRYLPYVKDIEMMLGAIDMLKDQNIGGAAKNVRSQVTNASGARQTMGAPAGTAQRPMGPPGDTGMEGAGGENAPAPAGES